MGTSTERRPVASLERRPLPHLRVVPAPPARRSLVRSAVEACRPERWWENGAVLLVPIGTGALGNGAAFGRASAATLAMCLATSAGFLLADLTDTAGVPARRPNSRRPEGGVPLSAMRAHCLVLGLAALVVGVAVNGQVGCVVLGHLLLATAQARRPRHRDLPSRSLRAALRVSAGAAAALPSLWPTVGLALVS